jgi:hypothetical protein
MRLVSTPFDDRLFFVVPVWMSVAVAVMFVFDFSEASPIKKNHNSGYSVSCLFFFSAKKFGYGPKLPAWMRLDL